MTNRPTAGPHRSTARVAGVMLLLSLLIPLLKWLLVVSPLSAGDAAMVTVSNVMASERLYRIGIAVDLVFTVSVMLLALCFYVMVEPVNRVLASLALFLKLAEAILWAASALVTVIALQVLKGRAPSPSWARSSCRTPRGCFSWCATPGTTSSWCS